MNCKEFAINELLLESLRATTAAAALLKNDSAFFT